MPRNNICTALYFATSIVGFVHAFSSASVGRVSGLASTPRPSSRLHVKGDGFIAYTIVSEHTRKDLAKKAEIFNPENKKFIQTPKIVSSVLDPVTTWTSKTAESVKSATTTSLSALATTCLAAAVPTAGFFAGPEVRTVLGACCLSPPLLGLWKREYTVSYGYGAAMALAGSAFLLQPTPLNPFAKTQALVLAIYGIRLSAMLLFRDVFIQHFKDMRERIEGKAPSNRLMRLPFIAMCGLLYACLACPLVLTARHAHKLVPGSLAFDVADKLVWGMVGAAALSATGDAQKTVAKHFAPPGKDVLVDWGVFYFFRHPNYTGEQVMWSCSAALGVTAALAGGPGQAWPWLAGSVLGAAGIVAVLFQATNKLEAKQETKYGNTDSYQRWVKRAWGGFQNHKKAVTFDSLDMSDEDRRLCEATGQCPVEEEEAANA